ncbi:MAG: zinc-binding dehydrogenase, partial [Armatimonadia bacterium]|nr:zinc-binding dehydrogenase [Armatimonadia bacterium]
MPSENLANPQITFTAERTVEVLDAEVPSPGPREVLVRTTRSLISAGTEGASFTGPPWTRPDGTTVPQYPTCPGYSSAGEVIAIGEQVRDLSPGDRVCSAAPHRLLNTIPAGGECLWKIPSGVCDEDATLTVLACTVLNGVRLGHPQVGETVAVVGLGILGQLAARYLSLTAARRVIGIDLDDHRLGIARDAGAVTHALNPRECDVAAEVRALTDGRGADQVFEVTGRTQTYDLCLDLARKFGTVVALGSPRWPSEVDMMKLHLKALNLVGAIVSSHPRPSEERNRWNRPANGELYLDLLASGAMEVASMITHGFPYTDAAEAYPTALGERGPALGVV